MINYLIYDVIIFSIIYFATLLITKDASYLTRLYFELWLVVLLIRTISFFYYRKYILPKMTYSGGFALVLWSNALIAFTTVFILSVTHFFMIPRLFAIQIIVYPFILDFGNVLFRSRGDVDSTLTIPSHLREIMDNFSIGSVTIWLLSVVVAYSIATWMKFMSFSYSAYSIDLLSLLLLAWLISTIFTRKYHERNTGNIFRILGQHMIQDHSFLNPCGLTYL